MTFIEWLTEKHGYTGDGSEFDIQLEYSADEIDHLYSKWENEGWDDDFNAYEYYAKLGEQMKITNKGDQK